MPLEAIFSITLAFSHRVDIPQSADAFFLLPPDQVKALDAELFDLRLPGRRGAGRVRRDQRRRVGKGIRQPGHGGIPQGHFQMLHGQVFDAPVVVLELAQGAVRLDVMRAQLTDFQSLIGTCVQPV